MHSVSGYLSFVPNVAAASLAMPIMDRQSGRFGVISKSMEGSFSCRASRMSMPGVYSPSRIQMPSLSL